MQTMFKDIKDGNKLWDTTLKDQQVGACLKTNLMLQAMVTGFAMQAPAPPATVGGGAPPPMLPED